MTRTGADGVQRIAFIGYVAEWVPDDASKTVEVKARAPESLILDDVTLPFPPPLEEHVAEPQVFDFWWKQLHYVFRLPDPRRFPPLPDVLSPHERVTVAVGTAPTSASTSSIVSTHGRSCSIFGVATRVAGFLARPSPGTSRGGRPVAFGRCWSGFCGRPTGGARSGRAFGRFASERGKQQTRSLRPTRAR